MESAFSVKESLMIVREPDPASDYSIEELKDHVAFRTTEIMILIDKRTCAFTYYDANGRKQKYKYTSSLSPGHRYACPADVVSFGSFVGRIRYG